MEKQTKVLDWVLRILSYVLVAVVTAVATLAVAVPRQGTIVADGNADKLDELEAIIDYYFIGEADPAYMEDMAANAMVEAIGDRWSYYVPAADMQAFNESKNNAYVGIGITIQVREDGTGFDILQVEPGGSAKEAGVLPGDLLVQVEGQDVAPLGVNGAKTLIQGDVGTTVRIAVLRDGEKLEFTLTRRQIQQQVASGQLLRGNVGYIRIYNFNARCAQETIALIEDLQAQGATSLLFDVRFNPGGYKDELVDLLDYLLPKGCSLFRSEDYLGRVSEDTSDARCLDMPMGVLMNADSYSAAEFFAAALWEYEYAFTAGQATTGKGYFQTTIALSDGSAVNLSIGKYYTPKGVSLAEVGGLVPDVPVEVDDETAAKIYSETLPLEEDPQIQAAIDKLLGK